MSVFGDNVAMLRAKFGFSQNELASKLGVSRGTIGMWETKNTLPDMDRLETISTIFNISVSDLFIPHFVANSELESFSSSALEVYVDYDCTNYKNNSGEYRFPCPNYLINQHKSAYYYETTNSTIENIMSVGSLALIDPLLTDVKDNKLYLVLFMSDYGLKTDIYRLKKLSNGFLLQPHSNDPTIKPVIIDFSETNSDMFRVLGLVVWYAVRFDVEL